MKERNYGIDLLRLVLMYMVCMIHTLGFGGIIDACAEGSLKYNVFWLMKVISFCAVNGFAVISGYVAVDKPRKYSKLADMWFQAFFYSFILTVVMIILGLGDGLSKRDVLENAFPVAFGKFWYFSAYFVLFFAIPVLNRFLFSVDENTAKKAFIIIVVIFTVIGILNDSFELRRGYSAIWLIILYCIGVLAKRIKLFENKSTPVLIIMWVFCILITWATNMFAKTGLLVKYTSPTMLFGGIILVVLFSRIRLKGGIISKLSPLAFGVYLFQLNQVIWTNVIKGSFSFVADKNVVLGVIGALAIASCIFVAGMLVEFIRSRLASLVKLSKLSEAIVCVADKALIKISVLLR